MFPFNFIYRLGKSVWVACLQFAWPACKRLELNSHRMNTDFEKVNDLKMEANSKDFTGSFTRSLSLTTITSLVYPTYVITRVYFSIFDDFMIDR